MNNEKGIDFIGDIHCHADELEDLLKNKLGYVKDGSGWKHPDPIAFFVGDYIDRGPKIRETLYIVRQMVEEGSAKAIMGNHEHNAIFFYQYDENGGHLGEHSIKNLMQHYQTSSHKLKRVSQHHLARKFVYSSTFIIY